jgi:hypothetical protein
MRAIVPSSEWLTRNLVNSSVPGNRGGRQRRARQPDARHNLVTDHRTREALLHRIQQLVHEPVRFGRP